jgi:hypothetical protein
LLLALLLSHGPVARQATVTVGFSGLASWQFGSEAQA